MLGINKEPTIVINSLSEMLRQLLPALVILGVINISSEKQAALSVAIGLVLGFFTTLLSRNAVVPTAIAVPKDTSDARIETALRMPSTASVGEVIRATEENK